MNICIISPSNISEEMHWGGIHTHTKLLSDLLIKSGHSVTLLVPGYSKNLTQELFKSVNVISLEQPQENVNNCRWLKEGSKIIKTLNRDNPFNFIIAEGNSGFELIKFKDFKKNILFFVHIPSFTHIYNTWKDVTGIRTFLSYFFKSIPRILHRILFREIPLAHFCVKTLSVSKLKARQISKYYFIPSKKISVVNNWVDINFFIFDKGKRVSERKKHSIPENAIVFLLMGALWRPKGFSVAIKAFKLVSNSLSNTVLFICGEGKQRMNLFRQVKSSGLENKVRFLGVIHYSELPFIYNAADIFLMPSLMSEGQAYTLIEAMACGLPAIATIRGGNTETIGDAGILVKPGDALSLANKMEQLAQNHQLRQELAAKARLRVLNLFSQEVAMRRIEEVLAEIQLQQR